MFIIMIMIIVIIIIIIIIIIITIIIIGLGELENREIFVYFLSFIHYNIKRKSSEP